MKTLHSTILVALVLLAAAASIGYSAYTTKRLREMEQRLQHAETRLLRQEALLQLRVRLLSDNATPARIRIVELPAATAQLANGSMTAGLEQRIQNIEQQIAPHLETLPRASYK